MCLLCEIEFENEDCEKKCNVCGETKSILLFDKNTNSYNKDNRRKECKACRVSGGPKDSNSGDRVRKKYGISRPDKGTCCEICGKVPLDDEEKGKSTLFMDHCHDTGTPRGFLCRKCNTAIGTLGDNLEGVMKAVVYLEGLENDGWKEKFKIDLMEEIK